MDNIATQSKSIIGATRGLKFTKSRTGIKAKDEILSNRDEMHIAKGVWDRLCKHYPGHGWHVIVERGLVRIRHMSLHADMGMTLRLTDLTPEGLEVMRAGGELLERFGIERGKVNKDKIREKPRDFQGNRSFDE